MINPNVEQKLQKTLTMISLSDIVSNIDIKDVYILDEVINKNTIPSCDSDWKLFESPRLLYKHDTYYWFKVVFDVKRKSNNELVYFCLSPNVFGAAATIRPQGLLYLNNQAVQGLDINHREVLLEDGHYEAYILYYTHIFQDYLKLDFVRGFPKLFCIYT